MCSKIPTERTHKTTKKQTPHQNKTKNNQPKMEGKKENQPQQQRPQTLFDASS